jgi:hypothetical protein
VGQVIYTSFAQAGEPGQPQALMQNHKQTERLLAESGLTFTALRYNQWPEMWNLVGLPSIAVATGVLPSNSVTAGWRTLPATTARLSPRRCWPKAAMRGSSSRSPGRRR